MLLVSHEEGRQPLDSVGMQRALRRIAHEIVERDRGADLVLVGIRTAGVPLAARLAKLLEETGELPAPMRGAVDITLYRDDAATGLPKPVVGKTEIPGHTLEGRRVILVDDVLYTGRTIRAALDALMDYGRPRTVELAVLVDRGHRELPIQPDYVGIKVETTHDEAVRVHLTELDGMHGGPDRVGVYKKGVA
ncbi:MAG: bifunctional pyr operon transcriptional regulator/uracil phosphoribosyltransferase PyrR [Polyangia bacterium]